MKIILSLLGSTFAFLLATSCCWLPWVAILLGGTAGITAFSARLEPFSPYLITFGAGMLGYTGFGLWQRRAGKSGRQENPILRSVITCPNCGFSKAEEMPTDNCLFFYACDNCKAMLKPLAGDCCVFCSYGTVKCPPVQTGGKDCC